MSEEKKSFSPFLSSWIRNKGKINSALSLVEDARRADVLFVGFHRGKTPRSKVTFLLEKKTESAILLRSNRSELFASAQQKRESDEIEGVAFISPSVHFGISDDFQRHVKNPDERFQEATRKKMSPSFRRRSIFFGFQDQKMFSVVDELVRTRRELNEVKEQLRLVNFSRRCDFPRPCIAPCAFS